MSKRERALELLESTFAFDTMVKGMIREEWNIEMMKESLDMLKEIYQRLKEKYETPSNGSYDLNMIRMLSSKLDAIERLRGRLGVPITQEFFPELKEDLVRTILDYYRLYHSISKFEENGEVKA